MREGQVFFLLFLFFLLDFYVNLFYIKGTSMDELQTQLRQFLNERLMGLEKASVYFGLSTAALSRFLNGKCNPNEITKYKIRKGLGLTKK